MSSPSRPLRGRCWPTRRRGLLRIHGKALFSLSLRRQRHPEVSARTPFSTTVGLNVVSTSLLTSTTEHPMLHAISDSSSEQLPMLLPNVVVLQPLKMVKNANCMSWNATFGTLRLGQALIATFKDQRTKSCSLKSELLGPKKLLQELRAASTFEKWRKRGVTCCQI